jgi:hypothetical protein
MSTEQVALITSCVECRERWLPDDEDRWARLPRKQMTRSVSTVGMAEREFGTAKMSGGKTVRLTEPLIQSIPSPLTSKLATPITKRCMIVSTGPAARIPA